MRERTVSRRRMVAAMASVPEHDHSAYEVPSRAHDGVVITVRCSYEAVPGRPCRAGRILAASERRPLAQGEALLP